MSDPNPYIGAYPVQRTRRGVWNEIARYVSADAPAVDTLVELGAGYCDFSNAFPARKKIALDLNPEMSQYAADDVDFRVGDAIELRDIDDGSVDLVFASNFLEHLDAEELDVLLPNVYRVLGTGGRLMLLQPNYRLCAAHTDRRASRSRG